MIGIFLKLLLVPLLISFSSDIDTIIQSSLRSGKREIVIPEGKYIVKNPIYIRTDNVVLKGKGNVVLISKIKGKGKAVINIIGNRGKFLGNTSKVAKKGDNILYGNFEKVDNVSHVWIYFPNTPSFVKRIGAKNWYKDRPFLRQGIYKVKRLTEKYIELDEALDIDYPPGTRVYVPKFVRNVIIENIILIQEAPIMNEKNIYKYENSYPEYKVDGIHIKWGLNVKIKNVKIVNAGRHPLNLEHSYGVVAENIHVLGAINKGKGGNGYVRFSKTYRSVLRNCYIKGIRHVVFQWASSRNTIENCKIFVDINFHGGYSRFNKVLNSLIIIPRMHPWAPVEKTPPHARWAPPDGEGNEVINTRIILQ